MDPFYPHRVARTGAVKDLIQQGKVQPSGLSVSLFRGSHTFDVPQPVAG